MYIAMKWFIAQLHIECVCNTNLGELVNNFCAEVLFLATYLCNVNEGFLFHNESVFVRDGINCFQN